MPKLNKVTFTIADQPDGTVKIISDPNFETMMQMHDHGAGTSAHGYALRLLNAARDFSRENGPNKILVPRLGRRH